MHLFLGLFEKKSLLDHQEKSEISVPMELNRERNSKIPRLAAFPWHQTDPLPAS